MYKHTHTSGASEHWREVTVQGHVCFPGALGSSLEILLGFLFHTRSVKSMKSPCVHDGLPDRVHLLILPPTVPQKPLASIRELKKHKDASVRHIWLLVTYLFLS